MKTIEFRLRTLAKDREAVAVEAFAWIRAWTQHAAKQSVDSQHGILSSARGLVDFCLKAGFIRRDPLSDIEIAGHKKRGKKQLHIDESRRFVARRSSLLAIRW
jgi:site-specific recombinase XerD